MANKKPQERTIPGKKGVEECNASLIIIKRIWIKPQDVDIRRNVKNKLKRSLKGPAQTFNKELLKSLKVELNNEYIVLPSEHPTYGVAEDMEQ